MNRRRRNDNSCINGDIFQNLVEENKLTPHKIDINISGAPNDFFVDTLLMENSMKNNIIQSKKYL